MLIPAVLRVKLYTLSCVTGHTIIIKHTMTCSLHKRLDISKKIQSEHLKLILCKKACIRRSSAQHLVGEQTNCTTVRSARACTFKHVCGFLSWHGLPQIHLSISITKHFWYTLHKSTVRHFWHTHEDSCIQDTEFSKAHSSACPCTFGFTAQNPRWPNAESTWSTQREHKKMGIKCHTAHSDNINYRALLLWHPG